VQLESSSTEALYSVREMSKETEGVPSPAIHSADIGEQLYLDCLALFSALSHHQASRLSQRDDESFNEELGKFFLWGEGFRNGKLDVILATSPYLRGTVLRFLMSIGDILTNGK
jgi:hypothetical protein